MKLTKEQKARILPLLRRAVEAQINLWNAEDEMEAELGRMFDGMSEGIENLAVNYDSAADVELRDVQPYIDSCGVSK